MENKLRNELADSLIRIYSLDIIPVFANFLQGEQAVLLALSKFHFTTSTQICKSTGIAKNRMSAIVNSLKKKSYINVLPDDDDKRKMNLSLSDLGRAFILTKENQANIILDRFVNVVGENSIKELIKIIDGAVEKMKEIQDE